MVFLAKTSSKHFRWIITSQYHCLTLTWLPAASPSACQQPVSLPSTWLPANSPSACQQQDCLPSSMISCCQPICLPTAWLPAIKHDCLKPACLPATCVPVCHKPICLPHAYLPTDSHRTEKTKCRKFKTNIPRKGISRSQFQFPHSCVCERIIHSHDGSAFSAGGNMWTDLGNI